MNQRLFPFAIAAGVVLLDRISKWLIKASISVWDPPRVVIPGFFNIVHTENPGIAFGLLADQSSPWRSVLLIGFSVIVLVVISVVLLKPTDSAHSRLLRGGLAVVLGGAFGNLYDRIVHGTVTDFIELHAGTTYYFPDFNIADTAITLGACLLLLDMWHSRERKSLTAEVPQ
ncbi:MAG TPA: signal peptidase II [Bryobacteraceae bacterium]|nr:signal peptidase II [Bryobacteraceae bacterium]